MSLSRNNKAILNLMKDFMADVNLTYAQENASSMIEEFVLITNLVDRISHSDEYISKEDIKLQEEIINCMKEIKSLPKIKRILDIKAFW